MPMQREATVTLKGSPVQHRDAGDGTPQCGAKTKTGGWEITEGHVTCHRCNPRTTGYWR